MQIKNEKDLELIFQKIVNKSLPNTIRNSNNSIRIGKITRVDTIGNRIDASILNTNENIFGVRYQSGAININLNDYCLVISVDPKNMNLNYAIVF